MYKVFLNDKVVVIAQSEENIYRTQNRLVFDFDNADQLNIIIDSFTRQDNNDEMLISCEEPQKVFEDFSGKFAHEEAAGGVVVRDDSILMIYRKGHWDLPKGKAGHGEGYRDAARREILEETGISHLSYVKDLPSSYHLFERDGKWILKTSKWFLFHTRDDAQPVPQFEEEITDAKWVNREELALTFGNLYQSLYDIVLAAVCTINNNDESPES